ncbi:hypothetical protein [Pseudorhodobacter aquimaris]|nr:hypothetical protein [Pseudorhodobacter aquimaris]
MPAPILVSMLLFVILAAGLTIAATIGLGLPLAALALAAVALRLWMLAR